MDASIIMWLGFLLAGYSVVGNDSIQTLGTFLASNERRPWYVLWLYAGGILAITLLIGWFRAGDVSYGRLQEYPFEAPTWPYLLPPLVLMLLTRSGIPVSTSFLILTFFKPKGLESMIYKSLLGYILAFAAAILIWRVVTNLVEKYFIKSEITPQEKQIWTVLQWCSTGFLWAQWLVQDFANIYVYLPRQLSGLEIAASLGFLLLALAYIFYSQGGAIQKIVTSKTNTVDIRSATIIDFLYASILLFFTMASNVPMSTTWVFLGILAGREIAIRYQLGLDEEPKNSQMDSGKIAGLVLDLVLIAFTVYIIAMQGKYTHTFIYGFAAAIIARGLVYWYNTKSWKNNLRNTFKIVGTDLAKVAFGLVVSVVLVYVMRWVTGEGF